MNRHTSIYEDAKNMYDKSGFSTKATTAQNLEVAKSLQKQAMDTIDSTIYREREKLKAIQRARGAGMELPTTETFETRKYLNDMMDPNARSISAMALAHLTHKTRDDRHRDFILDKIFSKLHITPAASEREIGVAAKVRNKIVSR